MGINTGYCNVGNFGSLDRMDYTIVGAEANLAARLQAIAKPGGIVLSHEPYALVEDSVKAHALPPITLKGIAREVVPYEVEGIYDLADDNLTTINEVDNGLTIFLDMTKLDGEAAERARVEGLGSNRMPGMAKNLTARLEEQYAHGRFRTVADRSEAPLEDALALLIRERLTGQPPPATAKGLVDVWRPLIETRGGKLLERLETLSENQEQFGRQIRDLLKVLEMVDQSDQPQPDDSEPTASS